MSWNAQALFCTDPVRRDLKCRYVHRLADKADIVLLQEVHGTEVSNSTWRPPPGTQAFWSQGPTPGHAGVGIIVRDTLLRQFSGPPQVGSHLEGEGGETLSAGPGGLAGYHRRLLPHGH